MMSNTLLVLGEWVQSRAKVQSSQWNFGKGKELRLAEWPFFPLICIIIIIISSTMIKTSLFTLDSSQSTFTLSHHKPVRLDRWSSFADEEIKRPQCCLDVKDKVVRTLLWLCKTHPLVQVCFTHQGNPYLCSQLWKNKPWPEKERVQLWANELPLLETALNLEKSKNQPQSVSRELWGKRSAGEGVCDSVIYD